MKLKKKIIAKYCILCVFFLLLVTIATANNFHNSSDNRIKQISTIGSLDNNDEIITFISGSAYSSIIHKRGIIRDMEIYAGAAGTLLDIKGWKNHPLERFASGNIIYIHAYHFIGIDIGKPYGPVRGIAFGNIEWSQ